MNGGSEAIKGNLKSLYNWDGSSSVASVATKLDADGVIAEWQLHIFGKVIHFTRLSDLRLVTLVDLSKLMLMLFFLYIIKSPGSPVGDRTVG